MGRSIGKIICIYYCLLAPLSIVSEGTGHPGVSGSLGTVSGRFWVPKDANYHEENQGSVRNCREELGIRL